MITHKNIPEHCIASEPYSFGNPAFYPLARQALYQFLKSQKIRKVYLPEYCALGAYLPYKELGFDIHTYAFDENWHIQAPDIDENSIFHYIHPFGLYIKSNMKILEEFAANNVFVLDDRALTLPIKPYANEFDAELYSLYKLVNIAFGAYLKSQDMRASQGISSKHENMFLNVLQRYLKISGASCINFLNPFMLKVYYKLFLNEQKYNQIVTENWIENAFPIQGKELAALNKIDIHAISNIRIRYAQKIFENIDERFLLSQTKEVYCSQALIGFPIFVNEPREFQNYLMKNGFLGFSLRNGWNPHALELPHKYFNNHYCLPMNQSIREQDIDKMIDIVNKF